jgi:hypothetical protein
MIANRFILIINILHHFIFQISLKVVCNLRLLQRGIIGMSIGRLNLTKKGETRLTYLKALKAADLGAYSPLLAFAGN